MWNTPGPDQNGQQLSWARTAMPRTSALGADPQLTRVEPIARFVANQGHYRSSSIARVIAHASPLYCQPFSVPPAAALDNLRLYFLAGMGQFLADDRKV